MTEEERAAQFRASQAAGAAAQRQRLAALTGDDAAAARVRAAWKPRFDALLPQPYEPLPEELEPRPRRIRVPAWLELPERYHRPR